MSLSVKEIKEILDNQNIEGLADAVSQFENDERIGVKKLVDAAKRRQENYRKELLRTDMIYALERRAQSLGYINIAGTDEVGRGPLAGPVVAGAVIIKRDEKILGIKDSKKLSHKQREELSSEIKAKAKAWSIGVISPDVIDRVNILNASFLAMKEALKNMDYDFLLVDGNHKIPGLSVSQEAVIGGDNKSISVGAASIIAKVYRDDLMVKFNEVYPGYFFDENKGYGTAKHVEAIKNLGPCPIHRKTFIKNFV